jgi:hypothetical protein
MNTAGLVFFLVCAVLFMTCACRSEVKSGEKRDVIVNKYETESL